MPKAKRARAIGLNHIALEVGDIDEALAFYAQIFDFELRGKSKDMAFMHRPGPKTASVVGGLLKTLNLGCIDTTSWGSFLLSPTMSAERPLKEDKCEIAETQLRLRARLELGRIAGYRPRPDSSQMAFRTCKEAMSDIWRWPVLKRKMAIRSRQKTTTSTPNIISDRCSPNRHNKRRLTQDAIG